MTACLKCNVGENEKPLLTIKFQGKEIFICPQCLPILIHKPAVLADKIPGADKFSEPGNHH